MLGRSRRVQDGRWAGYEDLLFARFKAYLKQHPDLVMLHEYIVEPFCHWLWRQNLWVHTFALIAVWFGIPVGVFVLIKYLRGF